MIPQPIEGGRDGRRGARSAVDDVQLAWRLVERDRAVRPAHDDILDSGSDVADQVDPGLDGERHPLAQRFCVAADDVRVLVALEPDSVPRTVEEGLAVAFGLDRSA